MRFLGTVLNSGSCIVFLISNDLLESITLFNKEFWKETYDAEN